MKTNPIPSKQVLDECFTYDPLTGQLFWKERPQSHFKNRNAWLAFRKYAGKPAGVERYEASGRRHAVHLRLTIGSVSHGYLAHRIIYGIMGVGIPDGMEIDHKNCDPFDNAWGNLRLATRSQNQCNTPPRRRVRSDTKGFPKGVTRYGKKFKAEIHQNGKRKSLGYHMTLEKAAEAYAKALIKKGGEFARLA